MKIVAQMIGHNEADRFLVPVLEHLGPLVDDIVFTDDGSTDNTADIAERMGAHVYRNEKSIFKEDEGKLRSGAWSNLENHAEVGDWILGIDCDEMLWAVSDNITLRKVIESNGDLNEVINIVFCHMWNETQVRVDKLWRPNNSSRLFKYYLGGKFLDKKLACGSEPTYVTTFVRRRKYLVKSGLVMQHLGYLRDEDKRVKFERYSTIDAGKFHNINHINSIMDENPQLVDWKLDGYPN